MSNLNRFLSKWSILPEYQDAGAISKLGYKKNSPYKDSPFLEIDSNYITMDGVDQPLVLYPDGDSPMVVQPNSGNYLFPNSTSVTEVPLKEFKKGGLKSSQRDLVEWTNQKWRTKSGKPSHQTGERYLPEAAIKALSDEEYQQTSRKKRIDGGTGSVSKQPEKIANKVRRYRMKEGGSTVNQAGNYTKPGMRKRLFNEIMNSNTMGTPSGKWSARKAQLLAKKYKEQGGGYKEQGGLVDYYVDNTPVMLMMNGGCMECGGMVKYEEGGYVIKKGDTLSKVSKETGIALQDIIAANNIKDPNKVQIGQSLVLPTSSVPQKKENIQINSDSNAYTIKKNDSLGAIAKKYNVSVQDLAKANNIENVNKITTGQKINIPTAASPYSNKELVKTYKEQKKKEDPKVPVTYDNKKLYKGLDESKINNEQVVLDHLKGKEPFVLIDKKTNTLKRYDKSGNIIGEMRVGLGSDKGDKFTINSKNKKVDRNTTPGGVYIVDERNPHESYRHLYDNNILLLKSQAGLRQATSIHQVPSGSVKRDQWLADNNLTNDDFSNGCINCNKEQFEKYLKTVGAGEKVVILPEEEGNYFAVKNGELSFTTNKNKEFGQYNFTPKSKEYRPLTYNFNTDTEVKSKYVDALKNEKKKLMKDLNLTSDEYDELAKRAYGILGQESSFGFGSFNPARDYKIEKWYTLAADDPEERKRRSLGLSQVRLSNVDPKFAEKYGIDTKTLYYPYQAALATMNVLADGLQAVRNPKIRDQYENMTPENVYDYVTTFYNKPETVRRGEASGKNTYVQNVNRNYQASESQPAMAKIKQYQQGGTSDKPIEMTLPEFTVVSSNPTSPNYDTLRLLKNTEEAFNNQLYPIWTNSGKPKIKELPPESKGRAFYQPINNTMGVRMYNETLISQIPNKKDRELLEEAISPNARPLTDKELDQIESLYNKYATYPTPHSQDVLAELAHSLQLKVRGLGSHITKYKKDTKMVKAKDSDSPEYDKLYDIPNTIEHEAHTILEPQLERYTTGLKRYTLDVPNMTAEDYKKQYGGTVKSFLNKWL